MPPTGLWQPVVVCHQLRSPENLGAIARVMCNFGWTQLILSDPLTHDFRGAEKLGVGGESVLRTFAVASSLSEALQGVVYAVGSTSRSELKRRTSLTPEEGAGRLSEHAQHGPVALVFGGEKRGLSDDELARCQDVVAIPTPGSQPSMNVAAAAAVLIYVCSRQARPQAPAPAEPGARLQIVQALEEAMKEALLSCEFLNRQAPDHVLLELSRSLVRGGLRQREAQLWLSAFQHVLRTCRRSG